MDTTSRASSRKALILSLALCVGSASLRPAACEAEQRAWVITRPDQLRDLYLYGELTDSVGNRWEVGIVPGIVPQLSHAKRAVRAAGSDLAELQAAAFWTKRRQQLNDGMKFAFDDVWKHFLIDGLKGDYHNTSSAIAELLEEKPFAWAPRLAGDALGGYLIVPGGRVGLAPVGMMAGVSYSFLAPGMAVMAPPLKAVGRFALDGVVYPASLIALHHPVYLLAIMNPEPAERHDGRFWLRIIKHRAA